MSEHASELLPDNIEAYGIDGRDVVAHFTRTATPGESPMPVDEHALWLAQPARKEDVHAGFVGRFVLDEPAEVEFRMLAVSVFRAWLDGEHLLDGPTRFPVAAPTCLTARRRLEAGEHRLAAHVHGFGVKTRLLADVDPFLWCRILPGGREEPVEVDWLASPLRGYAATGIRTSELLGWIEWCDTRVDGHWWDGTEDLGGWQPPQPCTPRLGPIVAPPHAPVPLRELPLTPIATGSYRDRFVGYDLDDPAVQIATCDLEPSPGDPVDGTWRRYDLGRTRTGTVRLTLDAPAGSHVLIAFGERLYGDRVVPVIPLSAGRSCFVSRFVLRGGEQTVEQLFANGARYVELRISGPGEPRLLAETFVERDGLGPPRGRFECGDERLEAIFDAGLRTLRASADDALIDSVRERAQWTGDSLTVGLEIGSAGWSDLTLFRQVLLHAAECANPEGLVAGTSPGEIIYVGTYAAYWVSGCVRYVELTGDRDVLHVLLPAARANVAALRGYMSDDGAFGELPWPYVDWGHVVASSGPDPALLAIVLSAVRDLRRWEQMLGEPDEQHADFEALLTDLLTRLLPAEADGVEGWRRFGYHATVWALRCDLVSAEQRPAALARVREQLQQGFPNDPAAPRLHDPAVCDARVITPMFAHYALGVLLDAGEVDFAIEQWRSCWGWMLDQGAVTWWEVFDESWSHCHFWSGCPTWQMSRYLLGLRPRWDRGAGEVDLVLRCGSLERASGTVPLPGGEADVSWERRGDEIAWQVTSSVPLALTCDGERHDVPAGQRLELTLSSG